VSRAERQPPLLWLAAAAAVLALVGGFAPWLTDVETTFNGREVSDGRVMIGIAIASLVMLAAHALTRQRWPLILPIVAGAFGAVICISDRSDFRDKGATIEWGMYAAIVGLAALAVLSIALAVTAERGAPAP
jgi:hypothetical protein